MSCPLFSRTVIWLGWVSLYTDLASEMLYPVLPLYLEQISFSVAGIGVFKGLAQGLTGLSKGWFGHWSDRVGRRVVFVRWGYGLSALSKPLMVVWQAPVWVTAVRALDRLGKGGRRGARDAMLAAAATQATRGRVFGLHRGIDTFGAALGPLIAMMWLAAHPADYRSLFVWALLPSLAAVGLTFLLREPTPAWPRAPACIRGRFSPIGARALGLAPADVSSAALCAAQQFRLLLAAVVAADGPQRHLAHRPVRVVQSRVCVGGIAGRRAGFH